MVNFFHNVHTAYQHKQEMKRKSQNQTNQRSDKRFLGNNHDPQYNEFLQWQQMRNQRISNSINNNNNNYNNFQASRYSNQCTSNTNNRTNTPTTFKFFNSEQQ